LQDFKSENKPGRKINPVENKPGRRIKLSKPKFKRILLKLSGEALKGDKSYGLSAKMLQYVANEVLSIHDLGIEIGIVVGGGNIFRGDSSNTYDLDRTTADHIGMLATVINSLAIQSALEKEGIKTRVQTAISINKVAEPYIPRRALRQLEKKKVVIFAAGTGNPFFTTDTAAALRANEINADVLLKATKVDGLYDDDPIKNKKAKFIKNIKYLDALKNQLKVMDMTAVSLAMDNELPIIIFNLFGKGNLKNIIFGEEIGTLIGNKIMGESQC